MIVPDPGRDAMEWDLPHLSRYPFLREAREYVRSRDFSMEQMLSPEGGAVQEKALKRIEEAIDGAEIVRQFKRSREDNLSDLLSYPIARFMVASIGDPNLSKWFAHHEGERARTSMESETPEVVLAIGEELELPPRPPPAPSEKAGHQKGFTDQRLRSRQERPGSEVRPIHLMFNEYLHAKRNISGPSWDLANRRLMKGLVEISLKEYMRLLQEKVRERVEDGLDQRVAPSRNERLREMLSFLRTKLEGRKKRYSPTDLGRVTITRLPPCMRQVLGMSQSGENLPHHARFALVTFLNAIGLSQDDIFRSFTHAPDFKPDIVKYQIEHITGASSSTTYMVPNCDTMKTGGICYSPDALCEKDWMTNPLIYYRVKGRRQKGGGEVKGGENAS